jgi:hypothetical protein
MAEPETAGTHEAIEVQRAATNPAVRSVLLAVAAIWFLFVAFMRIQGDPATGLADLVQRIAFGFALLAVALIDWRRFRWWWLVVGLFCVALAWVATDHPLLFLVGS